MNVKQSMWHTYNWILLSNENEGTIHMQQRGWFSNILWWVKELELKDYNHMVYLYAIYCTIFGKISKNICEENGT